MKLRAEKQKSKKAKIYLRTSVLRYVVCLAILQLLFADAVTAKPKKEQTPAGVDSATVQSADSLAKELFGEQKIEEEAMQRFSNGKDDFNAGEEFTKEADELRAAGIDTALGKPSGLFGLLRQAVGDTTPTSKELDIRKRAESSYKRAEKEFERALQVNPEMKEVQLWLVATYDRLQEWDKSMLLYREILNERQGEDRLWFSYGYACLMGKQYERAVTAFDQAISIHYLVNEDSAKTPNRYRLYLGEAYLRTYQDRLALIQFETAQRFAAEAEAAEIQKTIEWIQWDNGGIAAAEYRDAAFRAENEMRWNDAREAYLAGVQAARTNKAKDELSYRLALLEFREGSKSDGLARMKSLIDANPSATNEMRENYGKMLYGYAQQVETNGETREALRYYLQATSFPWSGQGAGYVEIARIAANDLDKAIEHATKALEFPLSGEQKQAAFKILEEAYRSKGNWEKMKYYRKMQEGVIPEGEAQR